MQNLKQFLANVHGGTFVSIDTLTSVALKGGKKNPMQGRVTKAVTGSSVMVFTNQATNAYANMVRRRLEAEGKDPQDFSLSPRKWGRRVPNLPIVVNDNTGKAYLEVIFLRAGEVEYFLDGQPIAKADIEGLDVKEEGEQGGLENKVIIRTYAAESLVRMRLDKDEIEGPFTY